LALILYICATLSGIYVLSASARITPHDGSDDTMLITIEKGDTLWDLCQEHLKDPLQWRELSKYNDFTNPHLIYPGEQLRIPVAMAKGVVEIAEDTLLQQQQELKGLKAKLDAAELERGKLEADMRARNKELADLTEQLSKLQAQLESAGKVEEDIAGFKADQEKAIAGLKADQEKAIAGLENQISEKTDETKQKVESVIVGLKATDEHIATLQADVKTLLAQVETNQKAINEAKMMLKDAQGVHEEPSTSKRALVFLTTAAAGIGWFVMNAIGGRSGE